MTRVFLDDRSIRGDVATVRGSDCHHLLSVLRLGVGDGFVAVDASGAERVATISDAAEGLIVASLGPPAHRDCEPPVRITLYQGLPRLSRYEASLRMCTELGVAEFAPVLSGKSVVRLAEADAPRKVERWERIAESAARQSGRTRVPGVLAPVSFEAALARFAASGAAGIMPAAGLAGSDAPSLGEVAGGLAASADVDELALFVGPEAGFDLAEQAAAGAAGVTLVTMGPRILRTETAAVVAATVCLERFAALR